MDDGPANPPTTVSKKSTVKREPWKCPCNEFETDWPAAKGRHIQSCQVAISQGLAVPKPPKEKKQPPAELTEPPDPEPVLPRPPETARLRKLKKCGYFKPREPQPGFYSWGCVNNMEKEFKKVLYFQLRIEFHHCPRCRELSIYAPEPEKKPERESIKARIARGEQVWKPKMPAVLPEELTEAEQRTLEAINASDAPLGLDAIRDKAGMRLEAVQFAVERLFERKLVKRSLSIADPSKDMFRRLKPEEKNGATTAPTPQ